MQNEFKCVKPLLKWVGGKTQLLNEVLSKFPTRINDYHEIFIGGGSVLFGLLSLHEQGHIMLESVYAYDLNENLINFYKQVQDNPTALFKVVVRLKTEYAAQDNGKRSMCNPKNLDEVNSKESYYYLIRHKFNTDTNNDIERAGQFIFLNKTCFRGLYREGPKGFNVPYGHYKKTPDILNEKDLLIVHSLIQKVCFKVADFRISLDGAKDENDFVYLDPPYMPENDNSFVAYTKNGFNRESHTELFSAVKNLNCKFLMSNSNSESVKNAFNDFGIQQITAKRAINPKKPNSTTTEVLVFPK